MVRVGITAAEPDPIIKTHLNNTSWALKLYNDPTLKPFNNDSRILKSHTGDTFCASTLATPDTILAWQSFYHLPSSPQSVSPNPISLSHQSVEIISILKLGSGVNGHINISHGGFVSLLLDEVIGSAAEYERPDDKSTMTAYLKVDYKRPVPTPGVVLCRAWLERREGRKMWGRGTVEDGEGNVLAVGEALFLIVEKDVVGKAKL